MECSIFPQLFEKKKKEELQKYIDTRESEFSASLENLSAQCTSKCQKVRGGWKRGDVSYFDYWKSMFYLFLIIFSLIGAVACPIILLLEVMPELLVVKILLVIGGIIVGIIAAVISGLLSLSIPVTIFIIVISPIVYFVIYPLSRKAKENKYNKKRKKIEEWFQQEKSILEEQKTSDLKAHREATEREILEYRECFERQSLAKVNETASTPVFKSATAWLLKCIVDHLTSINRDENIRNLETTFTFSIYGTEIVVNKKKFYLTKPLSVDLEKMTLALALEQNITRDLPEDSNYQNLGDLFVSLTASHEYQNYITAVTVTLHYQAKNGAYLQQTQQKF